MLMNKILDHAENYGKKTVVLRFELLDTKICRDFTQFSKWLCANVGKQVDLPNKLHIYWDDILGCKVNITSYFEEYILPKIEVALVLALDDVDLVFEYSDIANDFCQLLRSWNDLAKTNNELGQIWKQLRLIILHSTEVYSNLDINSSPLAGVGTVITLPDFTPEHVKKLAQRYGLNWITNNQVKQLMSVVGGHPYLVDRSLSYIRENRVILEDFLQRVSSEYGPFSNHLREHLDNLQKHPVLAKLYFKVITNKQAVPLPVTDGFKLYSRGLVEIIEENKYVPKCKLYRQYFKNNLMRE